MRYFFDIADQKRDPDNLWVDLPNVESARLEAVRFAGELLRCDPEKLWNSGEWRVEMTDTEGMLLCTVITLAIQAPATKPQGGIDRVNEKQI